MFKKIISVLRSIVMLIPILIVGAIAKNVGSEFGDVLSRPSEPTPKQIEENLPGAIENAVQQINKKGAQIIDEIRLDRASAEPGLRLAYHYTLLNYTAQDIDPNLLYTSVQPNVKNGVCSSKNMKFYMQYGVIYEYIYSGNNGQEINRFEISKNDCTKSTSDKTQQITTPSLNIKSEKQKLTKTPKVTQTKDAIQIEVDEDKIAEIKGNRHVIGEEMRKLRLLSSSSGYFGRKNSEIQESVTLSNIPGDINNDGKLSGSEQYLRDHPEK
jgi:hypothetical protein